MEWLGRMTQALNYLEQRMEEPLDINEVARIACSSTFHFQRMFYLLTGVTVAEYVRRRKFTLAAQELASSAIRVLDVALKYGYESPESFAKAFRKVHGISPSAARGPGMKLRAYPRISFQLSLKGAQEMDYKIITKEAFKVFGKIIRVNNRDGENFRRIPKFWDECNQNGTTESLCAFSESKDVLGICMDFDREQEQFNYMIAVETMKEKPAKLEGREIPAATWAVFQSIGPMPHAIQEVWKRIGSEWFPATGYEHAGGPELEVYPPGNPNDENYRCEVWIPIIKK